MYSHYGEVSLNFFARSNTAYVTQNKAGVWTILHSNVWPAVFRSETEGGRVRTGTNRFDWFWDWFDWLCREREARMCERSSMSHWSSCWSMAALGEGRGSKLVKEESFSSSSLKRHIMASLAWYVRWHSADSWRSALQRTVCEWVWINLK